MNRIACVDFDGTIVEHAFPKIGAELPLAFEVLQEMRAAGWKLILWTCREDEKNSVNKQYLTEAVKFCEEHGVVFDAVNETIKSEEFRSERFFQRKPYCHCFIDDRNLGGFPGWQSVREQLLGDNHV